LAFRATLTEIRTDLRFGVWVFWQRPTDEGWRRRKARSRAGQELYTDETADAAIPIDRRIPSTAQVQVYELPQQQVAAIVHSGAFEDFTHGHTAILSWVEANGYQITGPYREIYIQQAAGTQAESTTEIQYPVDRAG